MADKKLSIRSLRHKAVLAMAQAAKCIEGEPGLTHEQQLDSLSHAKIRLIDALQMLELASHEVNLRDSSADIEHKIHDGVAAAEQMLASLQVGEPTDDNTTDNSEETE